MNLEQNDYKATEAKCVSHRTDNETICLWMSNMHVKLEDARVYGSLKHILQRMLIPLLLPQLFIKTQNSQHQKGIRLKVFQKKREQYGICRISFIFFSHLFRFSKISKTNLRDNPKHRN